MMVPWLVLHALFIPSLHLTSVLILLFFNNIVLAALVSVPTIPYAYVWVALFNYRFQFKYFAVNWDRPEPKSKKCKPCHKSLTVKTGKRKSNLN